MAGEKRVEIGVGDLSLKIKRVTKVDVDEQIDSDVTKTFDEPVSSPSSDGGYKIDISALEARDVEEFILLKRILKRMKTETGYLSVFETLKYKDGTYESENYFTGVRLSSNKVTYDAEDLTARDVGFNAETYDEKVNGQPIE